MKKDIHPKYSTDAKIICACGNIIETGSTVKEMKVEICSACHPFYTGKKKNIDTAGRVERFKKMAEKAEQQKKELALAKAKALEAKKAVKKPAKAEKKSKTTKKVAKKK